MPHVVRSLSWGVRFGHSWGIVARCEPRVVRSFSWGIALGIVARCEPRTVTGICRGFGFLAETGDVSVSLRKPGVKLSV